MLLTLFTCLCPSHAQLFGPEKKKNPYTGQFYREATDYTGEQLKPSTQCGQATLCWDGGTQRRWREGEGGEGSGGGKGRGRGHRKGREGSHTYPLSTYT